MSSGNCDWNVVVCHKLSEKLCPGHHRDPLGNSSLIFRVVRMDGCGINNKVGSRKNVFCLLTVENLCAKRSQVAGQVTFFCIGTGNEAASAGHTSGRIISEGEETIQLAIQSRQSSISIQIWKEYTDQIEISIINPSGVRVGPVPEILGPHRFRIGQTEILLYYGEPSPYSISQEIYIDLLPVESYLTEGIWRIVLSAGKIVTGQYEMWLPSDNVLNRGTGFLFPTDATTLTIPSSSSRAISVGAYDARTFAYADFSGRGFTRLTNMVKPDLVAPGVEVMTTTVGGGYAAFTGTSFATPFVTGSAALLMEWGIVRENDPYLYGEKVKAYLRRGAKKVPGFDEYPNEEVGYGALCTAQSIPKV